MSQIQEIGPALSMGKGCTVRFFVDHSKPLDSIDHHWHQASYDGKPDSDVFQVPADWHKHHDEHMEVIEGHISFTVEGKTTVLGPGEKLHLPNWKVHGLTVFKGEPAVFLERTDPTGEFKELFFRDLFQAGRPGFLMAMRAFFDGGTYASLPGNIKIVDQAFTTLVGGFAKAIVPPKPIKFERDLREPDGKEQENEEQNNGGDSSQTGDFRKRPSRAA